jgi:hypothetical protein
LTPGSLRLESTYGSLRLRVADVIGPVQAVARDIRPGAIEYAYRQRT